MYGRYGCYTVSARFTLVTCPIRPRLPDIRQSHGHSADERQLIVLMGISPQLWFSQSPPQCLRRLTVLIRFNARAIGWKEVSLSPLLVLAVREELSPGRAKRKRPLCGRSSSHSRLPVHHPAATVTYLLKVYGVFNELEGLHRPSESTDFFAPHLYSFLGPFGAYF